MADTDETENKAEYQTKVEEIAPSTRKVTVEIPADVISAKLDENFKEIRTKAALPGFRPGHAPQKLVEKRFGSDIRNDVQRQLIGDSYQKALETNKLDVVGEPEFDNPESIKLPDSGSMTYSFQVEIRPSFELPELKGITVKRAKVEVNETHLEQAMKNLREQQGTLVPVEDRGLQAKDYATADVSIKSDGNEIGSQKDAQFIVQPGRIGGIFIQDIDTQLDGAKIGDTKTVATKAPEDHPKEELRGKDVQIDITIKDIKRLELAEINQEFLESLGFENEQELKDALKEQMEIRVKNDVQQAMRDQVNKYLLENVKMEVPVKLSQRQTQRIVQRRASDLMMRGLPESDIVANIEKIKAGADQQAAQELKSFFILDKIAQQENIEVDENELNGQIAMIAAQMGERPEKVKQRFSKDGTLMNMYLKLRENKAIDKILETAKIEEIEVKQEETKA